MHFRSDLNERPISLVLLIFFERSLPLRIEPSFPAINAACKPVSVYPAAAVCRTTQLAQLSSRLFSEYSESQPAAAVPSSACSLVYDSDFSLLTSSHFLLHPLLFLPTSITTVLSPLLCHPNLELQPSQARCKLSLSKNKEI